MSIAKYAPNKLSSASWYKKNNLGSYCIYFLNFFSFLLKNLVSSCCPLCRLQEKESKLLCLKKMKQKNPSSGPQFTFILKYVETTVVFNVE